jgi:hypothetical protein
MDLKEKQQQQAVDFDEALARLGMNEWKWNFFHIFIDHSPIATVWLLLCLFIWWAVR